MGLVCLDVLETMPRDCCCCCYCDIVIIIVIFLYVLFVVFHTRV